MGLPEGQVLPILLGPAQLQEDEAFPEHGLDAGVVLPVLADLVVKALHRVPEGGAHATQLVLSPLRDQAQVVFAVGSPVDEFLALVLALELDLAEELAELTGCSTLVLA